LDLATKITAVLGFLIMVAGLLIRQGRSEQRIVSSVQLLGTEMNAKIDALKLGQAQGRERAEEILAEVKAHVGNADLHVNARLESLKERVQEEFRHDITRKIDELLKVK
jgi:hypothetical protein